LQGEVSVMLENDNLRDDIDAAIHALAVQVVRVYEGKIMVKKLFSACLKLHKISLT
jgi:hypothetical protein